MKNILLGLCILLCTVFSFTQQDDSSLPVLRQRVTDQTGTLTTDEILTLTSALQTFEQETSNQIVVLIIPTLNDQDIVDYVYRVGEKNKLGKKDNNNGVLFLIAKDDRKMRIAPGYGLEGALPDALCDQIMRHDIAPRFKSGDYYDGISAGIEAIMLATKGEYKGDSGSGKKRVYPLATIILIIFFIVMNILIRGGRRGIVGSGGRYYRSPWWGGFGGGGFGGGSSGGFGGGGFGGGGFSGGGGSFGGGGASGSW
jgi:uncharacterized protein